MIEITNRLKSPTQVVIKSKTKPRSMTVLNIPGIGSGKNVVYLADELTTEYVTRSEKIFGFIKTKYISDNEFKIKGD